LFESEHHDGSDNAKRVPAGFGPDGVEKRPDPAGSVQIAGSTASASCNLQWPLRPTVRRWAEALMFPAGMTFDQTWPMNMQTAPGPIQPRHRVLVVDDERNIRLVLRTTLEMAGYIVEDASDGSTAYQRVVKGGVDLMVLDLNMPVLDGMALMERLHNRRPPKPRVIVLTAHGSVSSAVKAVRLGASDFLEKPVIPGDLLLSVAAVMAEPASASAAADFSAVLDSVRQAIRSRDSQRAGMLLAEVALLADGKPAYFNLLGVIHEAEGDRRAARAFYRKVADRYEPARRNLSRLYELETYGKASADVQLGDEAEAITPKP
jgi:DNA-binding response OmpR family regulator